MRKLALCYELEQGPTYGGIQRKTEFDFLNLQISSCAKSKPSAISFEWKASNQFDLSPYASDSVKLGKNNLDLNVSVNGILLNQQS